MWHFDQIFARDRLEQAGVSIAARCQQVLGVPAGVQIPYRTFVIIYASKSEEK